MLPLAQLLPVLLPVLLLAQLPLVLLLTRLELLPQGGQGAPRAPTPP